MKFLIISDQEVGIFNPGDLTQEMVYTTPNQTVEKIIEVVVNQKIEAIVVNAITEQAIDLIPQIKALNDQFPMVAIVNQMDSFPQSINPFHCFLVDEIQTQSWYKNFKKLVSNYSEEFKKHQETLNLHGNKALTGNNYNTVLAADEFMKKYKWQKQEFPKRNNPILEMLDKMADLTNEITTKVDKSKSGYIGDTFHFDQDTVVKQHEKKFNEVLKNKKKKKP